MTRLASASFAPAASLLALLAGCGAKPPLNTAASAKPAPLAVFVENRSRPVLCAEEDNVSIAASSAAVRSFRIEAAPPVYAAMLQRDSTEPDWTACDMSQDPAHPAAVPPRVQTLYEDESLQVVGHTLPTFWRPSTARVRIGDRSEPGIHLLQVWLRSGAAREEVLVMYPQDGYFRIRPRPIAGFGEIAYGSSFLVGPIEYEQRPIVRFEEVAFDPRTRTFTLRFARGGSASLRMLEVSAAKHALDVRFDRGIDDGPFAMLRSMYITEFNNDVARIALREQGAHGWSEGNIMDFEQAQATDVWMGRLSPSQHNTSSPDTIFHGFSTTDKPRRPDTPPAQASETPR
jgi:predicted small lipoprotein YifL